MNESRLSEIERADQEAVEWVLLLRECPDDPDVRARFDRWLESSPANSVAWADTAYAYDLAGDIRPVFSPSVRVAETRPVLPMAAQRRPAAPAKRPWTGARRMFALPIAACLAGVLVFAAGPSARLRMSADYSSGVGQVLDVALADGSVAKLAPKSAIKVTYANNRRQVTLLRGQAWFDVRHDPSRLFYVQARGVTTAVLGTAFNVNLEDAGVQTDVARGRVRVDYATANPPVSEFALPGQSVKVGFNGTVLRSTFPVEQVAAWRNRQIIVHDRPVAEVIDAIRPWYRGVIIVRGERLKSQRATGVYNADDPIAVLQGLAGTFGAHVTTLSPWVALISSN
jgi:transmembrane sensor